MNYFDTRKANGLKGFGSLVWVESTRKRRGRYFVSFGYGSKRRIKQFMPRTRNNETRYDAKIRAQAWRQEEYERRVICFGLPGRYHDTTSKSLYHGHLPIGVVYEYLYDNTGRPSSVRFTTTGFFDGRGNQIAFTAPIDDRYSLVLVERAQNHAVSLRYHFVKHWIETGEPYKLPKALRQNWRHTPPTCQLDLPQNFDYRDHKQGSDA